MSDRRNYYRILGVQPDAPTDVIRGAYRTCMQTLQAHPDLGGDAHDAATLNAAWRVLRDPQRRHEYDCRLLEQYDLRVVATGGQPPQQRGVPGRGNRRNFYRVLGVQRDAPLALIRSAYRIMTRVEPENGSLIDEAFRVLGDATRRRQYDEALVAEAPSPDGAYVPLIESYCAFCRTPHNRALSPDDESRCVECRSPLQRTESAVGDSGRAFERHLLQGRASLFLRWPGAARPCRLTEVTPAGLQLDTPCALPAGQIVRVESERIDAVGQVVHCRRSAERYRCGLRLLTASFDAPGLLVDAIS